MFYATGERRGNYYHYYYSQKQPREQHLGACSGINSRLSISLRPPYADPTARRRPAARPSLTNPILTSGEIFLRDGGREIAQGRSRAMQASLLIPALAWAQAQRWVCVCVLGKACF